MAVHAKDPIRPILLFGDIMNIRRSMACKSNSGERGSAILLILGFLILMLVVSIAFMDTAVSSRQVSRTRDQADRAKAAAASGVAQVKKSLGDASASRLTVPNQDSNKDGDNFLGLLNDSGFPDPNDTSATALGASQQTFSQALPYSGNPFEPFTQYATWCVERTGRLDPNYFGRPSAWTFASGLDIGMYNFRTIGASPLDVNLANTGNADFAYGTGTFDAWWRFGRSPSLPFWKPYDPNTTATITGRSRLYPSDALWYRYEIWKSPVDDKFGQAPFFPWTHDRNASAENPLNTYREDLNGNGTLDAGEDLDGNGRLDIFPRVPLATLSLALANLKDTTNADALPTALETASGSATQPVELPGGLPWLAKIKARRYADADYASYLELLANLRDYVDADSYPATNLASPLKAYTYTSTPVASPTAAQQLPMSTIPTYPYCGTETVPGLSEVRLEFNDTGVSNVVVEIANPYDFTQYDMACDEDVNDNGTLDAGEDFNGNGILDSWDEDANGNGILDAGEDRNQNGMLDGHPHLAVVAEISWINNGVSKTQRAVVARWKGNPGTSSILYSSKCLMGTTFSGLSILATDTVTGIRLYLVYSPGISAKVLAGDAATVNAAIKGSKLLDAWVFDLAVADRPKIPSYTAGSAGKGTITVPLTTDPNAKVSEGAIFLYNGIYYVCTKPGGAKTIAEAVSKAKWNEPMSPQPKSDGTVTPLNPGPSTVPGAVYYVGTALYVYGKNKPFVIGTVTPGTSSTASILDIAARDLRNNTRWTYQGNKGFSIYTGKVDSTPTIGSLGQVNPDWLTRPLDSVAYPSEDDVATPATADLLNVPDLSTAYVRNGSFQTLWEIGSVNRAELWRTLRLTGPGTGTDTATDRSMIANTLNGTLVPDGSYLLGDWPLLDQLCLSDNGADDGGNLAAWQANGCRTEWVKINPNAPCNLAVFTAVLGSLRKLNPASAASPQDGYNDAVCDPTTGLFNYGSWKGNNALVLQTAQTAALARALVVGNSYLSRGRMAAALETGFQDIAFDTFSYSDRDREEIIGKMANLFDTRIRYYEVVSLGRQCQYLDAQGNPGVPPNRPPDLIRERTFCHLILEKDTYRTNPANPGASFLETWRQWR